MILPISILFPIPPSKQSISWSHLPIFILPLIFFCIPHPVSLQTCVGPPCVGVYFVLKKNYFLLNPESTLEEVQAITPSLPVKSVCEPEDLNLFSQKQPQFLWKLMLCLFFQSPPPIPEYQPGSDSGTTVLVPIWYMLGIWDSCSMYSLRDMEKYVYSSEL